MWWAWSSKHVRWVGILTLSSMALADEPRPDPHPEGAAPAARLTIVERTIALDRGDGIFWQVDYRLKNEGPAELVVTPATLSAQIDGWVSNSRVPGHAVPRRSCVEASGASGLSAAVVVLPSSDEAQRCRERLILQAWPAELGPVPPDPVAKAGTRAVLPEEQADLRIVPGQMVRVRLKLEHDHPLYGPHDPLLGTRSVVLQVGPALVRDQLILDRTHRLPRSSLTWTPSPPEEYLDRRVFLSAPDSLHLEAQVPGRSQYRFPDLRGVRYGSRMRLSFWYLVAPGSDGQYQARITQYREVPNSWRTLYDGEVIESLGQVGRWVQVQRVFRVEPEATTLALDFRIIGADVIAGDLWIDDVQLEPIEARRNGP